MERRRRWWSDAGTAQHTNNLLPKFPPDYEMIALLSGGEKTSHRRVQQILEVHRSQSQSTCPGSPRRDIDIGHPSSRDHEFGGDILFDA